MKIGILETGRPPEQTQAQFGLYPDAFQRLLDGYNFSFQSWAVLMGELPSSPTAADGWLITGSRFGAYEPHAWLPPLTQFLQHAYQQAVPIVGICFGHQLLAQALGGQVEKFSGGWSVGRVEYQLDIRDTAVPLYAWHQDQIIVPPPDAAVAGSTLFCRYAALRYGNKAYTIQPHPEFSREFITALLLTRGHVLPVEIASQGQQSLQQGPTESAVIARHVADFYRQQ